MNFTSSWTMIWLSFFCYYIKTANNKRIQKIFGIYISDFKNLENLASGSHKIFVNYIDLNYLPLLINPTRSKWNIYIKLNTNKQRLTQRKRWSTSIKTSNIEKFLFRTRHSFEWGCISRSFLAATMAINHRSTLCHRHLCTHFSFSLHKFTPTRNSEGR